MRSIVYILLLLLICNQARSQENVLIDSLNDAIRGEHDISEKIDLYIELGNAFVAVDIEQAFSTAKQALMLARQSENDESQGAVHLLLGSLAMQTDSVIKAEKEFKLAIDYLSNTGSYDKLIKAHMLLGNRYIEKSNYPEAMNHYLNGIRISEESNTNKRLPNLYNNLGVVYINMNKPTKALELYSKALKLFEESGDSINVAGSTTNIGSIYIQLGNFDIARDYYVEGLLLFEQIENKAGMAHALFKLGLLDEMQDQNDDALDYLQQSVDIQQSMDVNPTGSKTMFLAETYVHMGINYFAIQKFSEAEKYLDEGLQIAGQTNQYSMIALASQHLSTVHKRLKNYETALAFYETYKQFSDSIYNEENVRRLTQLEMQYQFEQKLTEARLEKEVEKQRRNRNNLIYILLIAGLVFVLVVIALLLKLEKNKKNKVELERAGLEEKLEHTNKEMTTYVMYLLRKNEFILSIIEKLKKTRIVAKPENQKVIAELINELKSNTDSLSWEEFELRFQEVHTNFYTSIRNKFPDLTSNEIRMCAFFRLNMTSKEIAAITYQSLNSIKVARYRLRKKLKLSQDDNLISFLAQF